MTNRAIKNVKAAITRFENAYCEYLRFNSSVKWRDSAIVDCTTEDVINTIGEWYEQGRIDGCGFKVICKKGPDDYSCFVSLMQNDKAIFWTTMQKIYNLNYVN